MATESKEIQTVIAALLRRKKMVAMLAPSFVIDFTYPQVIGKLKRLGFEYVVEVAYGAHATNQQLLELMKKNPNKRYITNPCPAIVGLIKTKFPHLQQFLTPIDSPMIATAKLVKKAYPEHLPVFIGPCVAKKYEAERDFPELGILVLTYKELARIFALLELPEAESDAQARFDVAFQQTRLYPISGGLVQSANISAFLPSDSYRVISGFRLVESALTEFATNPDIKLLDILFCEGGCIGGPGIISKEPIETRRRQVIALHTADFVQKV